MTETLAVKPSHRVAYRNLLPGDPAPWFRARSSVNPSFVFDTVAGRHVVLAFLGSSAAPSGQSALKTIAANRARFDDEHIALFGVSVDPADEQRLLPAHRDIRWFWDGDQTISRLYGAAPVEAPEGDRSLRPLWAVLDPGLRVTALIPMRPDGGDADELRAVLDALPPVDTVLGEEIQAPILMVPNVFEPELCRRLIDAYRAETPESSGFMVEENGRTVLKTDSAHKVRKDVILSDKALIQATQERIHRRIRPAIQAAHQFDPTRMERYLVGCYSAADKAHFRAHRDNKTKGTAHRRFAVSINLNADFEGGEVGFPEFGSRTFKPRPGSAVVFSCSLLHRVTPVTRGERYAFLPFLYDDAAARLREENNRFLGDGTSPYRA